MGKLINHLGILLDVENDVTPNKAFSTTKALFIDKKLIWCRYCYSREITLNRTEIVFRSCMDELIKIVIDDEFNIKAYHIPNFEQYK